MLSRDERSKFLHQFCRHYFFREVVAVRDSSDEEAVCVRCLFLPYFSCMRIFLQKFYRIAASLLMIYYTHSSKLFLPAFHFCYLKTFAEHLASR